jgi:hypothetical protein
LLSEAKALSTAAEIRRDLDADDLAQRQAQWLVGRNPFSASIMYGEGYDWTPLYSVRSGQMVGALPVGIETKGADDVPYWPTQNCWTYKEVWTQPVGEWIWLMQDLSGPAVVRGIADSGNNEPVEFRDEHTGTTKKVNPDARDGSFRILLTQGNYAVRQGATSAALTVLSGGTYDLELRRDKAVDFQVKTETDGSGELTIRVTSHGIGRHAFSIRTNNLDSKEPPQQNVDLVSGKDGVVTWHAHIFSAETPWVAVVIPDGALARRQEVTGMVKPQMQALVH